MQENTGLGFLKIQAVSAGGALPVEGALVIVIDDESKNTVASQRTDRSGLTETLSLPAPERSLSQSPNSSIPYSTYTVQVTKDGYLGVEDYTVPVFDGITSIQIVNLIPKSEFASPMPQNGFQSVETPGYPSLRQELPRTSPDGNA